MYGGFCNWKTSVVHKTAVDVVDTIPKSCADIGGMLSSACALEKKQTNNIY